MLEHKVRLLAAEVGLDLEAELGAELEAAGAAQTFDQVSVFGAGAGDDAAGGGDAQHVGVLVDLGVEGDEPSQQGGPEQAVADLVVGLPVDQHLAAPLTARRVVLAVTTQVGHQLRISIEELQRRWRPRRASRSTGPARPRLA